MAEGISFRIGINKVDPDQYEGWEGSSTHAKPTPRTWWRSPRRAASRRARPPDQVRHRRGRAAGIRDAARKLKSGDIFFLTYPGTGARSRHEQRRKGPDGRDLGLLRRAVRRRRALRAVGQVQGGRAHLRALRQLPQRHRAARDSRVRLGRAADQGDADDRRPQGAEGARGTLPEDPGRASRRRARDGEGERAAALRVHGQPDVAGRCAQRPLHGHAQESLGNGAFKGNYRKLRDTIVSRMPATQTPNYYFVGGANSKFEAQAPFTV